MKEQLEALNFTDGNLIDDWKNTTLYQKYQLKENDLNAIALHKVIMGDKDFLFCNFVGCFCVALKANLSHNLEKAVHCIVFLEVATVKANQQVIRIPGEKIRLFKR